jgi:glucokinase
MTTEIVVADIGGTHARFALAKIGGGKVQELENIVKMKTAEHASLQTAWGYFRDKVGRRLPQQAAIAVACPVEGEVLQLTNCSWTIHPGMICSELGIENFILINDFEAVAHAIAELDSKHFCHLCGPDIVLPQDGPVAIIGPGTGLGVAQLIFRQGGYDVIATEGGHTSFAPLDDVEDEILSRLRNRYRRVSLERVLSGPGLRNIYDSLAAIENRAPTTLDDETLWTAALEGLDRFASAALDRFCLCLGSASGDIALILGAKAVIVAGGLGRRLADYLPTSGFASRFVSKGRFEHLMSVIPVKLILHPEPGLFGAAACFAKRNAE